jgi:hypothetical protein
LREIQFKPEVNIAPIPTKDDAPLAHPQSIV